MSDEEVGAFKALKAERRIRRQAQADVNRLADELAVARLNITKISAENKVTREDNFKLTEATKRLEHENRAQADKVTRRNQPINALRMQLTERGITHE